MGVEMKKPLLIGFSLFPEIHLTELILNVLGKSCVVLINFVTLFWTFHLWVCSWTITWMFDFGYICSCFILLFLVHCFWILSFSFLKYMQDETVYLWNEKFEIYSAGFFMSVFSGTRWAFALCQAMLYLHYRTLSYLQVEAQREKDTCPEASTSRWWTAGTWHTVSDLKMCAFQHRRVPSSTWNVEGKEPPKVLS